MTMPACWLLFSQYCEHRKTPACQSLHCWLMCTTVQSLQGSASAVWGWQAEVILWYYDHKTNAISLEPGNLILEKVDAYTGRRKLKDQWEEEPYEVEGRIAAGIPSYLMENQQTRHSWVLHQNLLLLITPIMGGPLCTGVWAEQTRCTTTVLEDPTQKASENEKVPSSAKCLLLAQHQTGETPLAQVNRKLHTFLRMFLEPPCQTKGEKFTVEKRGYADVNISVLDAEILITPMKLERCDQLQFLQSHLCSF